jgi:hypothetical protein
MNAMGHTVKTFIGVDKRDLAKKIAKIVPGYMAMGSAGMADMGSMEMPLPDNTLPMMTGFGQYGPIEMGGMFTVVKVRKGLAKDDYKDPGWYKHPKGSIALEWQDGLPEPERPAAAQKASETMDGDGALVVRKPHRGTGGHGQH